jgi:superfamily I DNA/RNA helicase
MDEARAVEGRPDAQEEVIVLYTMHAAKGLEWPIVVPINTMTGIMPPESAVTDRDSDTFYCPVFGVKPTDYDDARDAEKAELDREHIRLAVLKKLHLTQYGPEQVDFLRYRPVLDNRRLKQEFGYVPRKTSSEVFDFWRASWKAGK